MKWLWVTVIAINHCIQSAPNCLDKVFDKWWKLAITQAPRAPLTELEHYKLSYISSHIPKYCAQNLLMPIAWIRKTRGEASNEINSGPKNVLGTTPGYSLWSYLNLRCFLIYLS